MLKIQNFDLSFENDARRYTALDNISLEVNDGEMVALVGESGCGKSITASSAVGLMPPDSICTGGDINFENKSLLGLSENDWCKIRGSKISMIFQEPMTALNPIVKVGKQILENVLEHNKINKKDAKIRVYDIMKKVGLPDVDRIYNNYPFQLSGGMRQRIVIAMALVNTPSLIVADEPTTALDVTIQAQILELIKKMNKETKTAVLLISHDLGVIKNLCDRVYIMYAGNIVESGYVEDVMNNPKHPYTKGLIGAIPSRHKRNEQLNPIPGYVPSLFSRNDKGCKFYNRCSECMKICDSKSPDMINIGKQTVKCHLYN